jgi:broad specificity phosphatase PhoE
MGLNSGLTDSFEHPGVYLVRHAKPAYTMHQNEREREDRESGKYGYFLSGDSPAGLSQEGKIDAEVYGHHVIAKTLDENALVSVSYAYNNRAFQTAHYAINKGARLTVPPFVPIPGMTERLFTRSRQKNKKDWEEEELKRLEEAETDVDIKGYGAVIKFQEGKSAFDARVLAGFKQMVFLGKAMLESQADMTKIPMKRSGEAQVKILDRSVLMCFTHGGVISSIANNLLGHKISKVPLLGTYYLPWDVALGRISYRRTKGESCADETAFNTSFLKADTALRRRRSEKK